jgi:hypothetical protein
MATSCKSHPLVDGLREIGESYRGQEEREGLFEAMYERIRRNWLEFREPDRWPTQKNWVLRVAPEYTREPDGHLEKQLQKETALAFEQEGWGNDMPTASGLVNRGGRQMNIDLAREIEGGFELIEVKWGADKPYEAGLQALRYGAVYLLYRLEPELATRFGEHPVMRAGRIGLRVLAPRAYYDKSKVDLAAFEEQMDGQVRAFAERRAGGLEMSFRFLAFPREFSYRPGMERGLLCEAVRGRASPFSSSC